MDILVDERLLFCQSADRFVSLMLQGFYFSCDAETRCCKKLNSLPLVHLFC